MLRMLSTRISMLPLAFVLFVLFSGCSSAEVTPTVRLVTAELRPATQGGKPQLAGTCTFSHPEGLVGEVYIGAMSPPPTAETRRVDPYFADLDPKLPVPVAEGSVDFSFPVQPNAEYLLYCLVITTNNRTADASRRIVVP
ncbi:MAG: hypothetical protein U0183_32755 [Polyangiaceae bacterium]